MNSLNVKVVSPMGIELVLDDVSFIKVRGSKGDLGILPNHINFVTVLGEGQMLIRQGKNDEKSYFVSGGFLEVRENMVIVIAEDIIESSQEEIIRLQRKQAIEKATQEKLKEDKDILGTKKRIQDSLRK
ncbi:ATP synthase F1 subunit epsilon [Caviibacter abscessus]|uniref:ATP synthase F1 subunit epsilon n=1 Tax=Caviibacter abscessus TaxID=1766719 RepID=UPI0008374567|nr:ATP synthase F1 subunit epsilon [Caviibacter abscessus]